MDETQFKTLRELTMDGKLSQRELSQRMGLSLGKVNYVVNALLKKGYIKAKRFKNSKNKLAYKYILTPHGIRTKMELTYSFLHRKTKEYDMLKIEIKALKKEITSIENGD